MGTVRFALATAVVEFSVGLVGLGFLRRCWRDASSGR